MTRLATLDDLDALLTLGWEMSREMGVECDLELLASRLSGIIGSREGIVVVAPFDEEDIDGALVSVLGPVQLAGHAVEASEVALFTSAAARWDGVAKALVAAWEVEAKARGAVACVWAHGSGLESSRIPCERLAASLGYVPAGLAYRKPL